MNAIGMLNRQNHLKVVKVHLENQLANVIAELEYLGKELSRIKQGVK